MSIKDNFGNPKGLIGKFMLFGMNLGHTPMAKWAFKQFDVPQYGNFLDIGCGGGYNIKRLINKSKNGFVYGVDISKTSVDKSKSVNKSNLGSRCKIFQASADKLPFENKYFNLITAFETVYFWKDLAKCFKEIKRTLRIDGKFIIVNDPGNPKRHYDEWIPNMKSWTSEELKNYMEEAGFKRIEIKKEKYKVCIIGYNN